MAGLETTRIVLYADYLSQPCRAVKLFCLHNGIRFTEKLKELNRGDTRQADWLAFHPLGSLPCIDDNGFVIGESASILRYLASTRLPDRKCYPLDAQKCAKIDTTLDWHLANLRRFLSEYGRATTVGPAHFGTSYNDAKGKELKPLLIACLKTLETVILGGKKDGDGVGGEGGDGDGDGDGPFLMGKEICIADYIMGCEVAQCELLSVEERNELFGNKPRIERWMTAIKDALAPHWDEVHAKMRLIAQKTEAWRVARSTAPSS